jgi:hypothetical protein
MAPKKNQVCFSLSSPDSPINPYLTSHSKMKAPIVDPTMPQNKISATLTAIQVSLKPTDPQVPQMSETPSLIEVPEKLEPLLAFVESHLAYYNTFRSEIKKKTEEVQKGVNTLERVKKALEESRVDILQKDAEKFRMLQKKKEKLEMDIQELMNDVEKKMPLLMQDAVGKGVAK